MEQITERYFRALGWVWLSPHTADERDGYYGWIDPEGVEWPKGLPNILDHFPSFKKWVIEEMDKMPGRGFWLTTNFTHTPNGWQYMAVWMPNMDKTKIVKSGNRKYEAVIKDGEIPSAAVKAACEYLEGENG